MTVDGATVTPVVVVAWVTVRPAGADTDVRKLVSPL